MKKKYIIDSNNEIHSKFNDIRMQLFSVSPYISKKEVLISEKDYMTCKKRQKLIDRLKIRC